MGKRCTEIVQGREYLFRNVLTLSCPERKADDITGIAENDVGKVIENEFFIFRESIPTTLMRHFLRLLTDFFFLLRFMRNLFCHIFDLLSGDLRTGLVSSPCFSLANS